jgi:sulfide:quinone oxidoreductase
MSVVVLGAGFGGLQLAARLSHAFGGRADVVLIDRSDGFVFGFSKLDVMFGRTTPEHVLHRYADLDLPGVRFVSAAVEAIEPDARRVTTTAGTFEADTLVVALGADLDPAATPGLLEAGHEFYTEAGAYAAHAALEAFEGGRVLVAVTSTPFKCPPAPSETALMVHDLLRERGLLERSHVSLVMPLPKPIPPSPAASAAVLAAFAERGIDWHPGTLVRRLDAERRVAVTGDGTELPFDLFLGVPRHHAPAVVVDAGMTEDGWIPVDSRTLETAFPGVYAIGDVTSVGTPKAGVFAEGQADVVADAVIARMEESGTPRPYAGRGICWMEFGDARVAKVDVTFVSGRAPFGTFDGPSTDFAADKAAFGADRARRWFGTTWTPVPRVVAGQDSAGGV